MPNKDDWNALLGSLLDSLTIPVATRWGMIGGSLTSIGGWAISAQGVATIGLIITVGGFLVNYLFQVRRENREKELNDLLKEEAKERIKVLRYEQKHS